MVGVPGKSKGCNTCRKRKIACGLQRPACVQCIRSKRVCAGYEREKIWVLVDPGSSNSKERRKILKPDAETSRVTTPEDYADNSNDGCSLSLSSSTSCSNNQTYPDPSPPTLAETSSANDLILRSSNRQSFFHAFISSYFPPSIPHLTHSKSWLLLLPDLPVKVTALETSGLALAAAGLGRMHNIPNLINESFKLYTMGLREVQNALWSKKLMYEDGTFAACMSLGLYEVFECPNDGPHGHESHIKGLLSLVRSRGVAPHTSGAGHELFVGIRLPGILNALESETPNFLCHSIWMEGPWEFIPKTSTDRVVDCLARAPAVLQKLHPMPVMGNQQRVELAKQLTRELWEIDDALQDVYDDMNKQASGSLYWPVLSQFNNPADAGKGDRLFPVAYHFPDSMTAATLMLYWAVRVMLWSGLSRLYQLIEMISRELIDDDTEQTSFTSHDVSHDPLRPLGYRTNYLTMAHNVCQSVEYCLQDDFVMSGVFFLTPALGIVTGTLKNSPTPCAREVAWMRAALDMVRGKGLRLLAHKRV